MKDRWANIRELARVINSQLPEKPWKEVAIGRAEPRTYIVFIIFYSFSMKGY
tara:strand:- start:2434 stop:2589 length:156 start_codon:yes stop_codon:yes gene_type:complete